MKMRIFSPLVLGLALSVGACDLLDVNNPNNLGQDDVVNISAATAVVNGAQATYVRAYSRMIGPYSTTSDEFTWIGSRDAWNTLDQGDVTDPANEFVNEHFPYVGEARWMTDEAIEILEAHMAEEPSSGIQSDLARAYLYAGMAYTMIGEMFDDYALSDRQEAAPPIGPDNMSSLFDTAIQYFTNAITNADAVGEAATSTAALGMRMRAYHSRAVWGMLNPVGTVPAFPANLVNDPGANADAAALIAAAGSAYRYNNTYVAGQLGNDFAGWVNERQEMQVGLPYAQTAPGDFTFIEAFILEDPIDTGAPDPRFLSSVGQFLDLGDDDATAGVGTAADPSTPPLTVTTGRMAHLILAEAALAAGDNAGFAAEINAVRALNGMTAYSGQIPEIDMLIHERRVNLYLHGTRLHDHYRFNDPSVRWLPGSEAVSAPGTMFPITQVEIEANPNIG